MHHLLKRRFSAFGARLGPRSIGRVRQVTSHLELGHWLRTQGHALPPDRGMVDRWPILDVAIEAMQTRRPLYLEFGVYQGHSMRYVAERVASAEARFVGFDSFEGLPEAWRHDVPRGAFSLRGISPRFGDQRITVVKGWFDDTLMGFELPDHDQLLVNLDVDVYSSTRSVLLHLESSLRPGTLLYLDEFNDSGNELRAFRESIERTNQRFQVEAVSRCLSHWLFRFV